MSPALTYVEDPCEAVSGADIVLLLTEWREFVELDPEQLAALVAGRRILDARNALDAEAWVAAGWQYRGLGRALTAD
jgi:UDPglucose 6-dehydrogenase